MSANVPYFSSPDEPEKHYDAQSFRERLTNLKNSDIDTENMVRLGLIGDLEMPLSLGMFAIVDEGFTSGLGYEYNDSFTEQGTTLTYTSPSITFMVRRTKRFSVGADFFYATQKCNTYNVVTSEVSHAQKRNIFALSPTAQWNIIRHEWFRIYVRTGFSLYFTRTQDGSWDNYSDLFVGYGYTIGKRLFFFAETNVGLDSYVGYLGVGYRF